MGRRLKIQTGVEDPLILELPWGDFTVRNATRSLMKKVVSLESSIGDDASVDPDAAVGAVAGVLDAAVLEDGFGDGLLAAWNADEIGLQSVTEIAEAVIGELSGDGSPGEA